MAHVAFIVSVPKYKSAQLGTPNIRIGEELAQKYGRDLPNAQNVRFVSATASDGKLQAVRQDSLVDPTHSNVSTGSCAGPNATTGTVTGIKTTSVILSALLVDDTTHAVTDKIAHVTATATDTITTDDNESAGHLVLTWYDPAATQNAPV